MQSSRKVPVKGKKKSKVTVSNQVKLDTVNPIPFEYGGQSFSWIHQSAYLPFLPKKDTFAQMLLEARLLSTTHNACISTKKDYCAGNGFRDADINKELTDEMVAWFDSMNLANETVRDINAEIFEDFFTFGNVPIELVRTTVAGQRKLFIYVHSFPEFRLGLPNKDDIVQYAIQSKLFLRAAHYFNKDDIAKAKKLPLYSPLKTDTDNWFRDKETDTERTLIWFKNPVSGFVHYGLPSSVAAMIYQILEYKGARYNLDNFDNNMVVASILALKGQLSQEEATKVATQIIKQHTGDGKRGRTAVIASEEGIEGSDLHKFETQTDGSFTTADNSWTQKIILANQWDAVLAGIVSPSTLGKGAGFITKIHELKLNTVILPAQQKLMDKVWKIIFKIADEWLKLGFSNYNLQIKNNIDISGLTDVDISAAVTKDEVRRAKGLPEIGGEQGTQFMKSSGPAPTDPDKGGDDVPA